MPAENNLDLNIENKDNQLDIDVSLINMNKEIINEKYDIKIKERALENRKRLRACIQRIRSLNTKLEALFPNKSNNPLTLNEFLEFKK